jgi:putative flippase GtrA
MRAGTNSLYKRLTNVEFIRYFIVGVVGTAVDWGIFYALALPLNVYYQLSLVASFSSGAVTNYILNKTFTFRCKSNKIFRQFSVFFSIATACLLLSIVFMFIFVDLMMLHKMVSRIITTFIILGIGYLMQKNITFNKRFFS